MPSIFSKNCILTGLINHYCLICSKHFEDEEETLAHTLDPLHKQNLNSNGYFDKYKGDLIRKLNGVYFCELCNMTFPTATKVALHVAEETHNTKKSEIIQVVRKNNDIIAFGRYIISEDAWNGFIDETCFVCHAEFDDKAAHKISKSHILKLIKSDVILGDGTIYRKIDDKLYQCITCNSTISETELSKHFITTEHLKALNNYEVCNNETINEDKIKLVEDKKYIKSDNEDKNNNQDATVKNQAKTEKTQNKIDRNKDEKDIIQDKKQKTQDEIDKNKDEKNNNRDKTIKNQDETKQNQDKAEKNKDSVNKARKDNEKSTKITVDKRKSVVDLDEVYCKSLGAKDYVGGMTDEKWCILCERVLDVSADEHIRSKHHQTLLTMHKERLENNNHQNNTSDGDKTKILEFIDRYQKCHIKIDLINETAFCKKCCKNIVFDSDAIDKHIEDHKTKVNKKSQGKPLPSDFKSYGCDKTMSMADSKTGSNSQSKAWSVAKLEEFAKQHGLTRNQADNSFYCNACSRRLPTTREDLERHVGSKGHKENTSKLNFRKQNARKTVKKVPTFDFLETFKCYEISKDDVDIVVNGKYCLNVYSFILLARQGRRLTCHACQIDLSPEEVMFHIIGSSKTHMDLLTSKTFVITSLESEFIRELKHDVYHCGFCNIVERDWDDVLDHLATEEHQITKSRAQASLAEHAKGNKAAMHSPIVDMFECLLPGFNKPRK